MTGRKLFGCNRDVTVAGFVSFFMELSSEMICPPVPLFLANTPGGGVVHRLYPCDPERFSWRLQIGMPPLAGDCGGGNV
jgi:hypothetical protein